MFVFQIRTANFPLVNNQNWQCHKWLNILVDVPPIHQILAEYPPVNSTTLKVISCSEFVVDLGSMMGVWVDT